MREVCFSRPEAFVAHHYTRYMGDLSGGQMIARSVRSTYDLAPGQGAAFYEFDDIDDIAAFKAHYRHLLDQAPFDDESALRMIEEVTLAYQLNTSVLAELDADVAAARAAS
jgi:heme oxygenase